MTQYCSLCGKVTAISGNSGNLALCNVAWCTCGGVGRLRDRLAEAERLLREVRPFVDHADSQFMDYPDGLNQTIDAFLDGDG